MNISPVRLAEGVDAVAGIGVEVGAVHILQRGQVVLHVRLGLVDLLAGEVAVGEGRRRIGHQRPGLPVAIRGQGLAAETRERAEEEGQIDVRIILVPVLQPHGVADLVHHGGEAPRALEGEIVIRLVGAAEPDVARDAARVGREAAISGRGVLVGGLRDADVGVNGIRFRDLGERQARRRRDLGEGRARRRLLLGAEVDMVEVDAVAVQADAVVVRARGREAVGEVQGAPLGADQGRIDVAVAREKVASVRIGAERQKHADISAFRVGRVRAAAAAFLGGASPS